VKLAFRAYVAGSNTCRAFGIRYRACGRRALSRAGAANIAAAEYSVAWGRVGWLVAFLFAVAAAMRLARFNTSPGSQDKRFFVGLASPSAAGMVAGFVWLSARHGIAGLGGLALAFIITAMAAALMVSNLRYYSFKELNLGSRISFPYLLVIPLVLILISLEPPVVLFTMFTGYALSGPAFWLWRRRRGRRQEADET